MASIACATVHVGLNLVYLTPRATGGTETVARELIPELVAAAPQHRFTAFVNRDTIGTPGPWSDLIDAVEVPVRALNRIEWVRGEQQLLPGLARRAGDRPAAQPRQHFSGMGSLPDEW